MLFQITGHRLFGCVLGVPLFQPDATRSSEDDQPGLPAVYGMLSYQTRSVSSMTLLRFAAIVSDGFARVARSVFPQHYTRLRHSSRFQSPRMSVVLCSLVATYDFLSHLCFVLQLVSTPSRRPCQPSPFLWSPRRPCCCSARSRTSFRHAPSCAATSSM